MSEAKERKEGQGRRRSGVWEMHQYTPHCMSKETDCISRKMAIIEVKRFAGYLDEDMITRIVIRLNKVKPEKVRPATRATWNYVPYKPSGHDYVCDACGFKKAEKKQFLSKLRGGNGGQVKSCGSRAKMM